MYGNMPWPPSGNLEGVEDLPILLQGNPRCHPIVPPAPPSERGAGLYPRPNMWESRYVHPYDGNPHGYGIRDQACRHQGHALPFLRGLSRPPESSYQPLFGLPYELSAAEEGAPYYAAARAAFDRGSRQNNGFGEYSSELRETSSEPFFTYKTSELNEFLVNHPSFVNGVMSYDAHVAGNMVTASGAVQPFSFTINRHTGVLMSPYGIRNMSAEELANERSLYLDKVAGDIFSDLIGLPADIHPPYDPQVVSAYPTSTSSSPLHPRPNVTMYQVPLNQWAGAFRRAFPTENHTQRTEGSLESELTAISSELSALIA